MKRLHDPAEFNSEGLGDFIDDPSEAHPDFLDRQSRQCCLNWLSRNCNIHRKANQCNSSCFREIAAEVGLPVIQR